MSAVLERNAAQSSSKKKKQCPMNQAIQIARRRLGLDDETYQNFLKGITGKESTTEMSRKEKWLVVQALKKDGFKVERPGDVSQYQGEEASLVRHKWLLLKGYGILRDSSERALLKYVRRQTKVERMEWLKPPQMQRLVESIKKWVDRVERKLIVEALADGRLVLPAGFADYETFERYSKAGFPPDGAMMEDMSAFQNACAAYLDNYTPPKRAKG